MKMIVFDVGGVLRDSSKAGWEGFRRGFHAVGFPMPFSAQEVWHLRGFPEFHSSENCTRALLALSRKVRTLDMLPQADAVAQIQAIIAQKILPADTVTIQKIRESYKAFFASPNASLFISLIPGVKAALDELEKYYELALFTNAPRATVERDLSGLRLSRFSSIVSEDDVTQKKPSGEGLRKICTDTGVPPVSTLFIGDTALDIRAARDAGCKSGIVLTGMGMRTHIEKEKPELILQDLRDLARTLGHGTGPGRMGARQSP